MPDLAKDFSDIVLVLAGGNALGSYQAGAYESMHERGLEPACVVGASIGALNGAIIAGNPVETRLQTFRTFWSKAEQPASAAPFGRWFAGVAPRLSGERSAMESLFTGRPGLFHPRMLSLFSSASDASMLDHAPLLATLPQAIDFDCLNSGAVRFVATAVDVESGADATFDTARQAVGPQHLRASAAFPVLYPPVEIDGRLYMDGGVSANLPLYPLIGPSFEKPTLFIAVDLVSAEGSRPRKGSDIVKRAQDLVMASQARHAIEAFSRAVNADSGSVLLHVAYREDGNEAAGKMLDYSARSLRSRWVAGRRDMATALDLLDATATAEDGRLAVLGLREGLLRPLAPARQAG